MSKRFKNADAIWNGGACNPRAVARALVEAIDEAVEEGGGSAAADDPAVHLIIDHLCFLVGLPQPVPPDKYYPYLKAVEEKLK